MTEKLNYQKPQLDDLTETDLDKVDGGSAGPGPRYNRCGSGSAGPAADGPRGNRCGGGYADTYGCGGGGQAPFICGGGGRARTPAAAG